jgi:hypothetical protein
MISGPGEGGKLTQDGCGDHREQEVLKMCAGWDEGAPQLQPQLQTLFVPLTPLNTRTFCHTRAGHHPADLHHQAGRQQRGRYCRHNCQRIQIHV